MIGLGLSLTLTRAGSWTPARLPPSAVAFAYDLRQTPPLAVGGGAISDGAAVGSYPGRSPSPTLSSASGKELTYWAARRGGRPLLQGAAGKWLLGGSNVTAFTRVFVVAEPRWQEIARGTVNPPNLFASGTDYPGLIGLATGTVPAAIATGYAGTNHFLRPEDFAGQAITGAIDGVATTGLDAGALDRCQRVFEFSRASGWSGAPLVLGDDRSLGLAGRQWPGGIVAAYGLTSSVAAGDVTLLRNDLLAYAQGGACVAFVGDSITAGWGVTPGQSYRGVLHAAWKGSVACPTISIPGGNIPALLAADHTALDAMLRRSAYPILSLALGTNDIGTSAYLVNGGDVPTALANLTTLIAARKAAVGSKLKVILHTLPARKDDGSGTSAATMDPGWTARKPVFDAAIRANYLTMGAVAVCDDAADATVGDPWSAGGFQSDQIHPNATGHAAMAARLQPLVEALLP